MTKRQSKHVTSFNNHKTLHFPNSQICFRISHLLVHIYDTACSLLPSSLKKSRAPYKHAPEQGMIDFSFGGQQGLQQKRFFRESAAKSVRCMWVDARQGIIQTPCLLQCHLVRTRRNILQQKVRFHYTQWRLRNNTGGGDERTLLRRETFYTINNNPGCAPRTTKAETIHTGTTNRGMVLLRVRQVGGDQQQRTCATHTKTQS